MSKVGKEIIYIAGIDSPTGKYVYATPTMWFVQGKNIGLYISKIIF